MRKATGRNAPWLSPICECNFERHAGKTTFMSVFAELLQFLKTRKKYWLMPIVLVMLTIGALLLFAQGSVLAPFIYTLF
jgi:hypothetical protein